MNPPSDSGILCRFCGKRYLDEEMSIKPEREEGNCWAVDCCEGCLKKKVQVEVVSVD